ncbi:MAG: DUF420 domain-containing protein [Planctomycetia bacterium]|nr:DUF420 domain-containing protein [Planctomycetia bacterium]
MTDLGLPLPSLLAVHPLATTNAVLNATAAVLIVAGWLFIRRGNWRAHRAAMTAAFIVSTLFLICYLSYHALVGHVPFTGRGPVRAVYFTILVSHVLLAVLVPILAVAMFLLAMRGRWEAHRRLGRIAVPIWLYVSVTGVVIYLMLYQLYPGHLDSGRPDSGEPAPGSVPAADVPRGQALPKPSIHPCRPRSIMQS